MGRLVSSRAPGDGQPRREHRPLARGTLDPDIATQQVAESTGDGQSQPRPVVGVLGVPHPPELLKDRLQVAGPDPDRRVSDPQAHGVLVPGHLHDDLTRLRELHRVAEQIAERARAFITSVILLRCADSSP